MWLVRAARLESIVLILAAIFHVLRRWSPERLVFSTSVHVAIDRSGVLHCGALCLAAWFSFLYEEHSHAQSITRIYTS